jgi:ketosteroid isomerase-like protein
MRAIMRNSQFLALATLYVFFSAINTRGQHGQTEQAGSNSDALNASSNLQPARDPSRNVTDDQHEIVQTVRAFFAALNASSDSQYTSVVTPDFYSFEGGTRFNYREILSFIKAQRSSGRSYTWNVSEADVHVTGNSAWIAYLNKGTITDPTGKRDQDWLESAFLEKEEAVWKIAFLHSTRVPK